MLNRLKVESIPEYTVDIVIPVRDREEYDVVDRLKLRSYYNMPENFNIFIVDYGSSEECAKAIKSICRQQGYTYYYANTRFKLFNLSHARNIAILNSKADYLIYEDIDLVSHEDFYKWINTQIKSMIIERNWPFLVIPVAYISEEYSKNLYSKIDAIKYDAVVSEIFNPNSEVIEFYAAASSHIICSRKLSKLIGGFDESFEGWGFEDSDFELRVLRKTNIEKPRDFYKLDTRPYSNQTQWSGWRVLFRIFADIMSNKGIYSLHLWHPQPEHRSQDIRKRNHKIFKENSSRYAAAKNELLPLHDINKPTDLFLNENPHHFNLRVFHYFDNPLMINEDTILLSQIEELIMKYNIRNVIVNNPYGKEKRLYLYEAFKKTKVNVYIVERGALPNSIYFDPNGFCAESCSYDESNWLNKINNEKIAKTYEYINNYKASSLTLEPQKESMGGNNLKFKILGSSTRTKILFIALQSPSDTTTNYFCGDIESYDNYINEMQKICFLLKDSNWKVIYKNHPLTINKAEFEDALCVDNYHINDILEACDRVSLINSGVGVLAMIYNKPVYYFGEAFYATEGLNKKMQSASDLYEDLLKADFGYDEQKSIAFLSFLINDFYSFATWVRKERGHTKDAKMSISENITYEILRVEGHELHFDNTELINLRHSILFDRYRTEDYIYRNSKDVKAEPPKPAPPKAAPPKAAPPKSPDGDNKTAKDIGLIIKKLNDLENLQKNQVSNKKYSIKNKTKKLIEDPNQFFVDFFLKRSQK